MSNQETFPEFNQPMQSEYTQMKLHKLFDLSNRVAVVTGGAGLLGEEFCYTLIQAGAKVVVADIDISAAEELVQKMISLSTQLSFTRHEQMEIDLPPAIAVKTDVTNPDLVQSMVSTTLKVFGRLDILVNSAALDPKYDSHHSGSEINQPLIDSQSFNSFESFPINLWNQALDINLTGVFLCCQAAVKPMLAAGLWCNSQPFFYLWLSCT